MYFGTASGPCRHRHRNAGHERHGNHARVVARFPEARFIAMSGSQQAFNIEFNLECAREFGALNTFTKPLEREPFLRAVANALRDDGVESEPEASMGLSPA